MISHRQLTEVLTKAGIRKEVIMVFDSYYELPSPKWITKNLAKSFNKFLFDMNIKWTEDLFDCNKFSKSASAIADWCWFKTKKKENQDNALAFGMFGYLNHMICCAIHTDDGDITKMRLAFYEPQPTVPEGGLYFSGVVMTEVKLKKEEIESCAVCIFM